MPAPASAQWSALLVLVGLVLGARSGSDPGAESPPGDAIITGGELRFTELGGRPHHPKATEDGFVVANELAARVELVAETARSWVS